jgi:predicted nucleotidyltransferase
VVYLLFFTGLVLTLFAARQLAKKKKEPFDDALRAEVDRPLNRELVVLYQLQESVEANLAELDEKNQVFHHLVTRLEKQRETVDFRMQQLERLISRAEAVLNNSAGRAIPDNPHRYQHQQVYQLYDRGMDVAGVAVELGLGRGEVELILGLRR